MTNSSSILMKAKIIFGLKDFTFPDIPSSPSGNLNPS